MKKYRIFKNVLIVLIIFSTIFSNMIGFSSLTVKAAKEENTRHKSFNINNDVVFKGVFSSHSLYFDVDKNLDVQSLNTDILFNVSQLVEENRQATMTLSLNGVPFYSYRLVYNSSQETQNLKVSVPLRLIKEGMNDFKIEGYCRMSDKPCTDDMNTANWLTIQKASNLAMDFKDKEATDNLSEFPYPFVKLNEDKQSNTVIAVPDNFKEEELSAAFMLQAYLGKVNKYGEYSGDVVKYSNIPSDKDVIYIGGKDLPKEISTLYAEVGNESYSDYAVIKRGKSPFGKNNKLMLIVSENTDMLTKAVKLLMNNQLASQLNVDTFKVDKDTKVESQVEEEKLNISFKDLGLGEMQLKGPFRRSGSLTYVLPKNRALASGSKIKLFTRYSQNLDFKRSLLTVYLNGTPIGSKKLEKEKSNGDELELAIPSDVVLSNYIDIKIAFDLELPDSFCQFRQEEMPWGLVTADSFIYAPNNKVTFYKFDTYPQPFISDKQFNNTAIVIPNDLSSNEISGLGKMFSYIGKDLEYNNGKLKVVKEKNFSKEYHNMNLIVYGTPEKNKVIKDLNNNLWFKYDKKYEEFIGNEKLYLTKPYASDIATFQFNISPYNKKNALLALTAPKEDILVNSLMHLSNSKQILKLTGDCILVDKFGNLRTFKFKKEDSKSVYDKVKDTDKNAKIFIGFMGLFFIFAITSGGLYYFKNRKFK